MIPDYKNEGIDKGACKVFVIGGQIYQTSTVDFSKHKGYLTTKDRREGNGKGLNINMPKASEVISVN